MKAEDVLKWMSGRNVGASSKAMAMHMMGESHDGSYPLDPADFNRCLLFLQAVPRAREKLTEMKSVGPVWKALVERWHEIETTFISEAGYNWLKKNSAPETYSLMQGIINKAWDENNVKQQMKTESETFSTDGWFSKDIIHAMELGIDYAKMYLESLDAVEGRFTYKNRIWAERVEEDIRNMVKVIEKAKEGGK